MALPTTKKLIEAAKKGEMLSPRDRRQCIGVLMATQPELTGDELAEMFNVSERMIRFDKKAIREEFAKELKGFDPALIIGDILVMRDQVIANIEKSRTAARLGSRTYLEHALAPLKVMTETTKALQDLGFLPKQLGSIQVETYEYKAFVIKDNQVETRRLDLFDNKPDTQPTEDQKQREALDAEFIDVPQLPAAPSNAETAKEPIADADQEPAKKDDSSNVHASTGTQ